MRKIHDRKFSRRTFLKTSLRAGAALSLPFPLAGRGGGAALAAGTAPPKVILVSVDSLDPRYLYLDSQGNHGGCRGNWLMPNVRAFLEASTWFEHARCHMPSATDMNHVNAVAGTDVGQHGINMVSMQLFDWHPDGTPHIVAPSLSYARDADGRRVDTLFRSWKRRYPGSQTFYASGKEWVANIFKVPESGVDLFVGGTDHPAYLPEPPRGTKFYDPPGDPDAGRDDESRSQILLNAWLTQLHHDHFPPDAWVVDASLALIRRERPDFGVVLLAQMDDLQHILGAAVDPGEFVLRRIPFKGRENVSRYNAGVFQNAVLDGVRDVDEQFGRLVRGIRSIPGYQDTLFVLYSDHGHINHREVDNFREMFSKSLFDRVEFGSNTNFLSVLDRAGLLTEDEKRFIGFMPLMACSAGALHWMGSSLEERLAKAVRAKEVLLRHRVWDPFAHRLECPWWVMDIEDMQRGLPGVAYPGELYHPWFAQNNEPGTLHWPDLILFMKNHWQLPTLAGLASNLGVNLPEVVTAFLAPVNVFQGGHGSVDTQDIVMAFSGPGIPPGRVVRDEAHEEDHRISDIGVTLSWRLGLPLESNTVGKDLGVYLT